MKGRLWLALLAVARLFSAAPAADPAKIPATVDLLSLRAYHEQDGHWVGGKNWNGPQPTFHRLR